MGGAFLALGGALIMIGVPDLTVVPRLRRVSWGERQSEGLVSDTKGHTCIPLGNAPERLITVDSLSVAAQLNADNRYTDGVNTWWW